MSDTYNDGEMLADSFEVFIEGQIYTANSFTPTSPSLEITANDIHGAVARQRFVSNVQTGTIELQINAEAQNQPLKFKEFIVPAGFGFDAEYEIWVLIEETQNVVSGSTRTRSFNCRRVLNPVDVMVVEGAGTSAANGVYLRDGDSGGRPLYRVSTPNVIELYFASVSSRWVIESEEPSIKEAYITTADVASPDLGTWEVWVDGTAPAPTVRRGTRNDL